MMGAGPGLHSRRRGDCITDPAKYVWVLLIGNAYITVPAAEKKVGAAVPLAA